MLNSLFQSVANLGVFRLGVLHIDNTSLRASKVLLFLLILDLVRVELDTGRVPTLLAQHFVVIGRSWRIQHRIVDDWCLRYV